MSASMADVLEGRARWALLCADNSQVLPELPDKSVAHVITDPPYSEHVHRKQWVGHALTTHSKKRQSKYTGLDFAALEAGTRAACAGMFGLMVARWVLVFSDLESSHLWRADLEAAGLDYVRTGVWRKPDAAPQFTGDRPGSGAEAITIAHRKGRKRWNGGGKHAVFEHCINDFGRSDRHHPTPKPVSLMLELVELFTDPDDVVLDPFAGSGTTGVACLRLGRRFIGMEKDAGYAKTARERLEAEAQGLTLRDARAGQLPMFPAEAK